MSYTITLATRIRATAPLNIYVSPNGQDIPTQGLTYGTNGSGGFATPGYAVAWCNANLDAAGQPVTILVDGNAVYSSNPVPGACGGILLMDVLGTMGSWTESPITITGALNGIPLTGTPNSTWPVLSFNGLGAIVGVGTNTVWNIQYLQVQSTILDIEADRQSKINVKFINHGMIGSPYPSPTKYAACYGGSIEILDQIWINAGGTTLWSALQLGEIIGIGSAPVLSAGVSFTTISSKDSTSNIAIPTGWPH